MKTPTTINRSLIAAAFVLAATPFASQAALQVHFPDRAECGHETAYALDHNTFIDLGITSSLWGWQITVNESDKLLSFPLFASAGQNDITQGTEVGILLVRYLEGELRVTYLMHAGFGMEELHLFVGEDDLASFAPGSYMAKAENLNGASIFTHTSYQTAASVNVVAHAVVQVSQNNTLQLCKTR
ncbi:MAG: hypothetical protein D3917_06120 [Candidatus Electrothrix sp. AX5]|jgi:hypothetical protein|nr:hypothetical protein [Candidatus Electrothrix sp. AX5]